MTFAHCLAIYIITVLACLLLGRILSKVFCEEPVPFPVILIPIVNFLVLIISFFLVIYLFITDWEFEETRLGKWYHGTDDDPEDD